MVRPTQNSTRLAAVALMALVPLAMAQNDGAPMAMGAGSRIVQGQVTAVAKDFVSMKTPQGDVYRVSISPNTRVMKGRDPMKFGEIKVGDGVGAMGEIDPATRTVHALMMTVVGADEVQRMKDSLGKTFISGTVVAIHELKLTIKRTDGVEQVIGVDEDTSFRRGGMGGVAAGTMGFGRQGGEVAAPAANAGESITLADVKVGSNVAGPGKLKNGLFVPTTLGVSDPAGQRTRRPQNGAGVATTPPPATPPGMELR
jgi:hypothetical protein